MTDIPIYGEAELRAHVGLDHALLDVIEKGFAALAETGVQMPPVMRLDIPVHNGEMDAKTAYVPGLPYFALKVSCGFFDNPKKGLPSLGGLMNLFSATTGQVAALLLDNGYLTDIRTAAAGAVAARCLARENVKTIGVIGTGVQARLQVEALRLVRDFDEVLVWGRNEAHAEQYAAEMGTKLGCDVRAMTDLEALVRASDILITTTPSTQPLVKADWLRPGIHITAMGSDAPEKNELDPNILLRADRYVCDREAQCAVLGELHHALEKNIVPPQGFPLTELGAIVAGKQPGRENDKQVTVCDLTGTGVQDTVIACHSHDVLITARRA